MNLANFFKECSSDSKSQTSSRPVNKRNKKSKRGRKSQPITHKFVSSITENSNTQIFAISFNIFIKNRQIFASASGNRISVYECLDPCEDLEHSMKLLRVYSEPDKDEVFNAVAWSFDTCGPIIACGGVKGVVRVILCNGQPMTCYKNLIGHSKLMWSAWKY